MSRPAPLRRLDCVRRKAELDVEEIRADLTAARERMKQALRQHLRARAVTFEWSHRLEEQQSVVHRRLQPAELGWTSTAFDGALASEAATLERVAILELEVDAIRARMTKARERVDYCLGRMAELEREITMDEERSTLRMHEELFLNRWSST